MSSNSFEHILWNDKSEPNMMIRLLVEIDDQYSWFVSYKIGVEDVNGHCIILKLRCTEMTHISEHGKDKYKMNLFHQLRINLGFISFLVYYFFIYLILLLIYFCIIFVTNI